MSFAGVLLLPSYPVPALSWAIYGKRPSRHSSYIPCRHWRPICVRVPYCSGLWVLLLSCLPPAVAVASPHTSSPSPRFRSTASMHTPRTRMCMRALVWRALCSIVYPKGCCLLLGVTSAAPQCAHCLLLDTSNTRCPLPPSLLSHCHVYQLRPFTSAQQA